MNREKLCKLDENDYLLVQYKEYGDISRTDGYVDDIDKKTEYVNNDMLDDVKKILRQHSDKVKVVIQEAGTIWISLNDFTVKKWTRKYHFKGAAIRLLYHDCSMCFNCEFIHYNKHPKFLKSTHDFYGDYEPSRIYEDKKRVRQIFNDFKNSTFPISRYKTRNRERITKVLDETFKRVYGNSIF